MPTTLLICLVIGIADGDTLTVRCELPTGMENFKVRLAEIDAPEKGQAFDTRSKQHLSDVCFRKPAEVRPPTTDRHGRTVARVICDGIDASAEQVRAGMAWVFRQVRHRPGAVLGSGRGPRGSARVRHPSPRMPAWPVHFALAATFEKNS